jgi:hypothetical protein
VPHQADLRAFLQVAGPTTELIKIGTGRGDTPLVCAEDLGAC